jgi:D-serine deaminase-like pyridoxal phosphate-dependent protein
MGEIIKPTLVVNKQQVLINIERMVQKAKDCNLLLRPHFKSHQSAEIGTWFRDLGVEAITVSSIDMANYFAAAGWKDITIAFPVNLLQWREINALAEKINLNILVENAESIVFLEKHLTHPVGLFIKVDTGYHRTGVPADDFDRIMDLLNLLKTCHNLIFIGFLTHAGHTYKARGREEVLAIMQESKNQMLALKLFFKPHFPLLQLSWGDTPSCALGNDFYGFDEIRPGVFVFFDEMQVQIGSCEATEIAMAMICPVVSVHPQRQEATVYGGAVHLSKDFIVKDNVPFFGRVMHYKVNSWDTLAPIGYLKAVSQEHGTILLNNPEIKLNPGDLVAVLPVHACLTANLMKDFYNLDSGVII